MRGGSAQSWELSGHRVIVQQEGEFDDPSEGGEVCGHREYCGGGARVQVHECFSEKIMRLALKWGHAILTWGNISKG